MFYLYVLSKRFFKRKCSFIAYLLVTISIRKYLSLITLFYWRWLSPLLGIYIVNAFISVLFSLPLFVQMLRGLSSRQVNKLTSEQVACEEDRVVLPVDRWTSRQVNELLVMKTKLFKLTSEQEFT